MKILSVTKVDGWDVYAGWSNPMQVILTSEGTFTDNTVDSQYYSHKPGYDWSKLLNQDVDKRKVKIISKNHRDQKYDWLKWFE